MFLHSHFVVLLLVVPVTQSHVVASTLRVLNGGRDGQWGHRDFCPDGSYAIGFDLKIEPSQGYGDDTALNGIKLICNTGRGYRPRISSTIGAWGRWVGPVFCSNQGFREDFLTSFRLQVEAWGSTADDTAANHIEFKCRDFAGYQYHYTLSNNRSYGRWGEWGFWSYECPWNTAICGIQTRVEYPGGRYRDDTSLNDVRLFCCY